MQYRHHLLTVSVGDRTVRVASEPGPGSPIRVGCRGRLDELLPGETVVFPAPGAPEDPDAG